MVDQPTAVTASRSHLSEKNNNNNASISFDLTIEMTAGGDESSENVHASMNQISPPRPSKVNTTTNNNNAVGKQQRKIVLPILVSPDDGSLSMAWDEASGSSQASKSITTTASTANRVVRFQATTTTGAANLPTAAKQGGGGEDPSTLTTVDKLQVDISRQRLLRKRKEKALIKLAKELTKRTNEVAEKDKIIANQVDIIHQLEQQLLLQRTTHEQTSNATASAKVVVDETTDHLRKELLRLQLSNDRLLQAQSRWPPALTIVLVIIIGCLMHLFRIMSYTG